MKKFIILLLISAIISCKEDDATPTGPINDEFDPTTATLLKSGTIVGIGHTASGTASLYESGGKKVVVLDPYDSQNGPDLKVYLSKDINASSYISLGALKSVTGKQSYDVPGNPDAAEYNYIMVWCEQFTVVFGRAEIKK
jgi:hypothetical protein